ncbi:3-keto-disaccharide hydrolase [Pedobacter immunditicola]|uniref:3-keto-disaccharide hydrolase n=1 Tax=Pedobacter immunditicola TaxID=3133440 RepID=UPI0030B15FD4
MKIQTALLTTTLLLVGSGFAIAQVEAKPEDTEFYTPVPKVVAPGKTNISAPSDAIILFDGKNLDQWVMADDRTKPAKWKVQNGVFTVDKKTGNIETKQAFTNYQLHLEWQIPANITGEGQSRGNSGLFLASIGKGDLGYELQILDSYNNKTYTNGMAGSIYKQTTPLFNAAKKPGEWQTYDVIWTAPTFNADSSVKTPAKVTVLFNGVIIQNNFKLKGPTQYIGQASYRQAHGPSPIKLQSHGDKSEPISFRNIWIRELPEKL